MGMLAENLNLETLRVMEVDDGENDRRRTMEVVGLKPSSRPVDHSRPLRLQVSAAL